MSGYQHPRTDPVREGMKRCDRCEIDFADTADHFHKNAGSADGLDGWCKTCVGQRSKRYRQIQDAKTTAVDAIALAVGRRSFENGAWTLDRLGIAPSDDLWAKLAPVVAAYNATSTDEALAALGRVLLEAGAKLTGRGDAARVAPVSSAEDSGEAFHDQRTVIEYDPLLRLGYEIRSNDRALFELGFVPSLVEVDRIAVLREALADAKQREAWSDWSNACRGLGQIVRDHVGGDERAWEIVRACDPYAPR